MGQAIGQVQARLGTAVIDFLAYADPRIAVPRSRTDPDQINEFICEAITAAGGEYREDEAGVHIRYHDRTEFLLLRRRDVP